MLRDTENQSFSDNRALAPFHRVRVEAIIEILRLGRTARSVETVTSGARIVVCADLLEAVQPQRRMGGARRLRGIRIDRDYGRSAADQNRKCSYRHEIPQTMSGNVCAFRMGPQAAERRSNNTPALLFKDRE